MPTESINVVPLAISFVAIFFAAFSIPILGPFRRILIFLALGSGQIHLAAVALLTFLFAEAGYNLPRVLPRKATVISVLTVLLIVITTLFSTVTARTVTELAQLVLYTAIFIFFYSYLRSGVRIESVLQAMTVASLLVAAAGIVQKVFGIATPPHIFIGRGGNETSIFLLLMGIVPAMALYAGTKHLKYIVFATVILAAQILASSRANVALASVIIFGTLFLLISDRKIRSILCLGLALLIYSYWDGFAGFFEGQINYSTRERISLYEAGWRLWLESPLVGWGWGSTSLLAIQASLTENQYPHFHSTYVQFLVELGVLGLFATIVWITASLWFVCRALRIGLDPLGRIFTGGMGIALFGSAFTEALIFGADRAITVILILAVGLYFIANRCLDKQVLRNRSIRLSNPGEGINDTSS